MTRNFSELMTDTKPQEAHRTSRRVNAPQNKQKHYTQYTSCSNSRKSKTKKKFLKEAVGGTLFIEKQRQELFQLLLRKHARRKRTEQHILSFLNFLIFFKFGSIFSFCFFFYKLEANHSTTL